MKKVEKRPLRIDILTLFPEMFSGPFNHSLLEKAQAKGLIDIQIRNLRDFSTDKHHTVDDKPFGGGSGMVLKVEPIFRALTALLGTEPAEKKRSRSVIYLSPQGRKLTQRKAKQLSKKNHLILICGHYEGIDERAMQWIDEEISIGDYVLTGGELPAMVLTDTVCRLVPGVVKEWASVENDSFFNRLLDCSQYTRPAEFLGMKVPEVLLSGDHKKIESWKMSSAAQNTLKKRPDIVKKNSDLFEFSNAFGNHPVSPNPGTSKRGILQ